MINTRIERRRILRATRKQLILLIIRLERRRVYKLFELKSRREESYGKLLSSNHELELKDREKNLILVQDFLRNQLNKNKEKNLISDLLCKFEDKA